MSRINSTKTPNAERAAIHFVEADESWKSRVVEFSEWGWNAALHLHFQDGFSVVALASEQLVGMISVSWRPLPAPLTSVHEAFIDILEVHKDFRRQGIAKELIEMAAERARQKGAYQLRSWSSLDKEAAIPMWKELGFGLCPATTFPNGQETKGYFVTRLLAK